MPARHGVGANGIPSDLRTALAPLLARPASTAVLTDFDGTLSPIVRDPSEARPLDGSAEVLAQLARHFGVVAVISGRPVSYLEEHLDLPVESNPMHRVRLVGLYGLEQSWGDGPIIVEPAAAGWSDVVADAVAHLQEGAPEGVLVEPKGLAVTVHWRRAPRAEGWVNTAVAAEAERSGLRAHPGRMSIELRPPLEVDKGSVVRGLAASCSAACYFGDDLGDLPAFEALAAMGREEGMSTLSIAAVDDESDPSVAAGADVGVAGPPGALEVLAWLAASAAATTGGGGSDPRS
jgi:trehalose 6-phosphate phosphatase